MPHPQQRRKSARSHGRAERHAWKEDEDKERTTRGWTPFGIIALLHTSAARSAALLCSRAIIPQRDTVLTLLPLTLSLSHSRAEKRALSAGFRLAAPLRRCGPLSSHISCLFWQLILSHISSRITCPVSFLPREPKPSAVVTSRVEGSVGLVHDYLYHPDQWSKAIVVCRVSEITSK